MAWPPSRLSLSTVLVETFASREEKIFKKTVTGGRGNGVAWPCAGV